MTEVKRESFKEVAIFWDYENVKVISEGKNVPLVEALIKYAESKGHPHIKRVYCNWNKINNIITQALYSLGFDPIQVSMGKVNSLDVKLAVDCIDTSLTHPSIKIYIIITGDKDFIPVVNWLKSHKKEVIIVGKPEIVSEHLLMSADDFVTLEQLSKIYEDQISPKIEDELDMRGISFELASECLKESIKKIREQGKSTRFAIVDNYMRGLKDFDYNGAVSIIKIENSGFYKSFTEFIDAVENAGEIKTETVEGFKEIFLIEEDPKEESEFTQTPPEEIEIKHWKLVFTTLIQNLSEANEGQVYRNKLSVFYNPLHLAKKEGNFPYSKSTIRYIYRKLKDIGFIIEKGNKILLVEDFENNWKEFLKKIL